MQVEVKRAQAGDIPVIEAILRDVAEWLDRGGQHQWSVEDVSWKSLSRDYQIEEFYIVYRMGEPVACMALQDYDPVYWPGVDKGEALFLHKLAVKRTAAGQGLAAYLIAYAKQCCHERKISALCLDCWRDRAKLRELYEREGFVCVKEAVLFNRYDAAFYRCQIGRTDIR